MANYSEVGGENAELLRAIINDTPYTGEITSRNSAILDSIIKGSAYTDAPESEIEALLLDLKEKIEGGGSIEVEELNVSENGTYTADIGKAFNPVNVDITAPVLIEKTITANGTYNASSDNADGFSVANVNVPLPNNAYLLKSIENTDVATFDDGTQIYPLKSLKVAIEPIQDLHGYDNPWVGGSGKNKCENKRSGVIETNGITFTVNSDGSVKANGTATATAILLFKTSGQYTKDLESNTNYIISSGYGNDNVWFGLYYDDNTNWGARCDTNGDKSFTTISDFNYVRMGIRVGSGETLNNVTFYPMIRLATVSDATFEPYSNICPISGHTAEAIKVQDTETDPQTEVTHYIPFHDGDTPLTVYGGTLDVGSGVLTVDKIGINVMSQEKNSWQVGTLSCCYRINTPSASTTVSSSEKHGAISNMLLEEVAYVGTSRPNEFGETKFAISTSGTILAVYDTDLTLTEEQFKTKYNDLFVVYPLATPLTYQLDSATVTALVGDNVIFASTGEVIKLEYLGKPAN